MQNGKSKITLAVKAVQASHRLLLSGTPIQNNVLELWSLFDFLMPGFLGTERQFNQLYGTVLPFDSWAVWSLGCPPSANPGLSIWSDGGVVSYPLIRQADSGQPRRQVHQRRERGRHASP